MTKDAHQKCSVRAENIGIVGDDAHVEGGIHFHTHTTPTGIPLQRPPRAAHFTDRERELARLLADLHPGRVATLCGPGGIGKTVVCNKLVGYAREQNLPIATVDGIRPDLTPDRILHAVAELVRGLRAPGLG